MKTAAVTFKGSPIRLRVSINDKEVTLTQDGDEWSGSSKADKVEKVRLQITAPKFTKWSLIVEFDDKKVLEKEGTTKKQAVDETWPIKEVLA